MDEETRKMDVKGFGFFLYKFCFHVGVLGFDSWMVIVGIACWDLRDRSVKMAMQWHAFGTDAESSGVIWDGVFRQQRASCRVEHCLKIFCPFAVAICIFPTEPAHKITIDKVKAEKGAGIETSSVSTQMAGWIFQERRTWGSKLGY
jgi:hypothetical protein